MGTPALPWAAHSNAQQPLLERNTSDPALAQLEAIPSCPVTCSLVQETHPPLSAPSFQGVVEGDEVSPQPPLLQTKPPQFPQPLPIRPVLQTLHQLRCPSLDTARVIQWPFWSEGPKTEHSNRGAASPGRVQGQDHFPVPAGHASADASQDAIGLHGHLGTLLAQI